MNIYFACSITGGRQDEAAYKAIVNALLEDGHEVPTAMLAGSEILALEKVADPVEVFTRDTNWIDACDALIAEVSTPSHGVGYEIGYALQRGKPVLCCHRRDLQISKMIQGNTHPRLHLATYRTPMEAVDQVRSFLEKVSTRSQKNVN